MNLSVCLSSLSSGERIVILNLKQVDVFFVELNLWSIEEKYNDDDDYCNSVLLIPNGEIILCIFPITHVSTHGLQDYCFFIFQTFLLQRS